MAPRYRTVRAADPVAPTRPGYGVPSGCRPGAGCCSVSRISGDETADSADTAAGTGLSFRPVPAVSSYRGNYENENRALCVVPSLNLRSSRPQVPFQLLSVCQV
ncbi:hypothetical protein Raf01_61910 [Rugosimonospora africana]|uniref:Uncharacterized protein n=1 Tax=Rugosimonospora africana TaxID=556532 RepID=A0A8J3QVT9_9ACTN|nr:hypothetical protein Raf01_61910 [Rugosimonospora africana]